MKISTIFLTSLLTASTIFANNTDSIDSLLDEYSNETNLVNETLEAGSSVSTVITADEIRRRGYSTLKEILSTSKFLNIDTGHNNSTSVSFLSQNTSPSKDVRLYLNNHELSTVKTDSGYNLWLHFPVDIIDHLIIYVGSGSLRDADEPGGYIVKIFTKEAYKYNNSSVEFNVGSYGTKGGSVLILGQEGELNYSLLVNKQNEGFKEIDGNSLDYSTEFLYANLEYKKWKLDLGYGHKKSDGFFGGSSLGDAENSYTDRKHFYGSSSYTVDGHYFEASIDYIKEHDDYSSSNILNMLKVGIPNVYSYEESRFENIYGLKYSKSIQAENNNLYFGLRYKHKEADITNLKYNDVPFIDSFENDRFKDYYSAFIENEYKISENNALVTGLKYDYNSYAFTTQAHLMGKLGLISQIDVGDGKIINKGFISNNYYPSTIKVTLGNNDIERKETRMIYDELSYINDNLSLSWFLAGVELSNVNYYNSKTKEFLNQPDTYINVFTNLTLNYKFDSSNNIELEYSEVFNDDKIKQTNTKQKIVMRLTNSWNKFDLYNELVYKKGYEYDAYSVDYGLLYNVNVQYRVSNNSRIKLKLNDVFNKDQETYLSGIGAYKINNPKATVYYSWDF